MPHVPNEHGVDADAPDCMANISPLLVGNIPGYIGKPHYLLCSDSFREQNAATEYLPTKNKHDSFIDIEPRTGRVIESSERWQVYLKLSSDILFTDLKPLVYQPYIIIDKTKDIGVDEAEKLHQYLQSVS